MTLSLINQSTFLSNLIEIWFTPVVLPQLGNVVTRRRDKCLSGWVSSQDTQALKRIGLSNGKRKLLRKSQQTPLQLLHGFDKLSPV
jgi:hypothetical protein